MEIITYDFTVYSRKTGEIAFICSCSDDVIHDNYDSKTQNFILGHYDADKGYVDVKLSEFVPFPYKPSQYYVFDWKTKEWVYQGTEQKNDTFNNINNLAGVKITLKYPIYAQLNIGRTPEADAMYAWIDSVRALADQYRTDVLNAKSEAEIDTLFAEYKIKLDAIQ